MTDTKRKEIIQLRKQVNFAYPNQEESLGCEPAPCWKCAHTVEVPFFSIDPKRKTTLIDQSLFKDIEQGNAAIIEITSALVGKYFNAGDFIIAVKFNSDTAQNGDLLIKTGRRNRLFQYAKVGNKHRIVSMNRKKSVYLTDEAIVGYYVVKWVFYGL